MRFFLLRRFVGVEGSEVFVFEYAANQQSHWNKQGNKQGKRKTERCVGTERDSAQDHEADHLHQREVMRDSGRCLS